MKNRILFAIAATGLLLSSFSLADIPRTSDGKPDLSGTYNIATITPVQQAPVGAKHGLGEQEPPTP